MSKGILGVNTKMVAPDGVYIPPNWIFRIDIDPKTPALSVGAQVRIFELLNGE